jgi:hypothetical protein
MVVLPRRGGYWVEGAGSESPPEFSSINSNGGGATGTMPKPKIDQDETALAYRKYFIGKVRKDLQKFPAWTDIRLKDQDLFLVNFEELRLRNYAQKEDHLSS